MRRLSSTLLTLAQRIMPASHQDWSQAMRAEAGQIKGRFERLNFAIGCLKAASLTHLRAARWEPLARAILCVHITAWVAAKLYIWVRLSNAAQEGRLDFSALQSGIMGMAGIAYLGVSLCIIRRKWIAAIGFGLAALGLNTLHLMATIFMGGPFGGPVDNLDILSLALISEEYFIWSTILVGGAGLWIWQTRFSKARL